MGASNVKTVYACWGDLPHVPFRVLVFMALTAKDSDEEPVFYAGRESLAVALGRLAASKDKAAQVAVERAIRSLKRHGAITQIQEAKYRQSAAYRINLHGPP